MTCSIGSFHASDGATVASADEVATLPASNLFLRTPFDRWRTPTSSGALVLTYSSALSVSQVAMLYTNATTAATIRVRAGTNTTTVVSSPSFDSGVQTHQPGSRDWSTFARTHFVLDLANAHSALCWRIDVAQVSGATYYEAGRLGLLNPWRPTRGVAWGDTFTPIDTSLRRRSRNGTAHVVAGGLYREVELLLSSADATEFEQTAGDLRRRVEARLPIFYAKAPRSLSLGNSPVGSIAMASDADVMDRSVYALLRDPWTPSNAERRVHRLRVNLEEVVHP